MLPQEAGQFYAVIPIQLDIQQQELLSAGVRTQPFHQRRGGMEHIHVIVLAPDAASSIQRVAGGGFILFRSAGVIFTNSNAVHALTSWHGFLPLFYHIIFTLTSLMEPTIRMSIPQYFMFLQVSSSSPT